MKDLVIIGGGVAGLSAGIYANRLGLDTLLIEKSIPGGLASTIHLIENYPGFPDGISGIELMQKMETQAKKFGLSIVNDEVCSLKVDTDNTIVATKTTEYTTRTVIIATGTQHKKLGVPGEAKLTGKGVSYCAVCDGPLFKSKHIAIIGCGNSGIQEGLFLLNFASSIIFVDLLEHLTADSILRDRIYKEDRVSFLLGVNVVSINGEDRVSGMTIKNNNTGEIKTIDIDGVFIYTGLIPNTNWLKGIVKLDAKGYIITNESLGTSVDGVFAAGDVRSKELPFYQIVSSASDGALAAFAASRYIGRRR